MQKCIVYIVVFFEKKIMKKYEKYENEYFFCYMFFLRFSFAFLSFAYAFIPKWRMHYALIYSFTITGAVRSLIVNRIHVESHIMLYFVLSF